MVTIDEVLCTISILNILYENGQAFNFHSVGISQNEKEHGVVFRFEKCSMKQLS